MKRRNSVPNTKKIKRIKAGGFRVKDHKPMKKKANQK